MSKHGSCDTCAHEGCCEHYCGGVNWSDAYVKCAQCGCEILWDCVDYSIEVDGKMHYFCGQVCLDDWCTEHDEEGT